MLIKIKICRLSVLQPIRLLESAHYCPLYIGGTVEDFTAYQNVGKDAIVTIILHVLSFVTGNKIN